MATLHFKWQPQLPLGNALGWIVEWYHLYKSSANLQKVTETQIERYDELCKIGLVY